MACKNNGVVKGFAQQQHPLLVQGGKQLLSLCGLYQKDHTGISLLHSGDAQFVPELIGQGSVDHDQLKIRFRHSAPCLGSAGNDHRAAVTHLGQPRGNILVGVGTGAYDQCASHFPHSFLLRWQGSDGVK